VHRRGINLSLTRRAFLALGGQAAAVVGLGGFIRFLSGKNRFLRPPGGPTEGEFLSLCIKCQKCREVCPTGAIVSVVMTEDVASAGTPRLSFRLGYCSLCLKCILACPTGALRPVEKETVKLGVAEIDKDSCIAWNWRGCTSCYKKCPVEGALTLDNAKRPSVDASKCTGCGLCEYVCPSTSSGRYTRASGKGIVVVPLGTERPAEP
jgi:ferredoxin-type protein NapG